MKVLAILLLCAFAAVQGRSAVGQASTAVQLASLGENPWVVHLRVAVATSGLLNSGAGSLISSRWVLTSDKSVSGARFIWIRYGAVNVVNPSLVTENSIVISNDLLALINVNREVHVTENISPISLSSLSLPDSANFCGFGGENGVAGELLACSSVDLQEDGSVSSSDGVLTEFDVGAPLVSDGVQVGVLVSASGSEGTFASVADYLEWIAAQTGLELGSAAAAVEPEADSLRVQFVN